MSNYVWTEERRKRYSDLLYKVLIPRCVADGRISDETDFTDKFGFASAINKKTWPKRERITAIVNFLQLHSIERSCLLSMSGAKDYNDLEGVALNYALSVGKEITKTIPYPAFIITRNDDIHDWNKYAETLFQITDEELLSVSDEERNILRYIFDTTSPVHNALVNKNGPREEVYRWYRYTARLNVLRFKLDNIMSDEEDWYKERELFLKTFPEFASIWDLDVLTLIDKLTQEMPSGMLFPEYVTTIYTLHYEPIKVRGLQINYIGVEFPKIIAYTYGDERAREAFIRLGLPTPDNGWGTQP